jgi:membrane protease YdiL (CAAX protease family)
MTTSERIPHATLRYTTLRLALFLAALILIWGVAELAGLKLDNENRLFLLAVALVVSSIASFFVLARYRGAMSAGLVARSERMSGKLRDSASFEDEDEDA